MINSKPNGASLMEAIRDNGHRHLPHKVKARKKIMLTTGTMDKFHHRNNLIRQGANKETIKAASTEFKKAVNRERMQAKIDACNKDRDVKETWEGLRNLKKNINRSRRKYG